MSRYGHLEYFRESLGVRDNESRLYFLDFISRLCDKERFPMLLHSCYSARVDIIIKKKKKRSGEWNQQEMVFAMS